MPVQGASFPHKLELHAPAGGGPAVAIPHFYDNISPVNYGGATRTVDNFLSAHASILVCSINMSGYTGFLRMIQNIDFSVVAVTRNGFRILKDGVICWIGSRQDNSSPSTPTLELWQQATKIKEIPFGGIVSMNEGVSEGDELAFSIKAGDTADYPVVTVGVRWLNGTL